MYEKKRKGKKAMGKAKLNLPVFFGQVCVSLESH